MPTYNYKCDECNSEFSVVQSIKDDPLDTCKKCGGKINRLIGGNFGLIFKGSGFYLTDYVKNKKTQSNKQKSSSKKGKQKNE